MQDGKDTCKCYCDSPVMRPLLKTSFGKLQQDYEMDHRDLAAYNRPSQQEKDTVTRTLAMCVGFCIIVFMFIAYLLAPKLCCADM